MANITEEHLHHMAKRHHATMKIVDGYREKAAAFAGRFFGTFETATGAWLGGAIEGKSGGDTFLKVPYNLGLGGIALVAAHVMEGDAKTKDLAGHVNNIANGLIGSYVAATGYAFGKRWKETGLKAAFSGTFDNPYADGAPPAVHGDLSEQQMANIVARMQAAAAHG